MRGNSPPYCKIHDCTKLLSWSIRLDCQGIELSKYQTTKSSELSESSELSKLAKLSKLSKLSEPMLDLTVIAFIYLYVSHTEPVGKYPIKVCSGRRRKDDSMEGSCCFPPP